MADEIMNGIHEKLRCENLKNATPGARSVPETPIDGYIIRVDGEGFGIVGFIRSVGEAQLGFFTPRTEFVYRRSRRLAVGASVHGLVQAVDLDVPENAGPLALPLKKLELT